MDIKNKFRVQNLYWKVNHGYQDKYYWHGNLLRTGLPHYPSCSEMTQSKSVIEKKKLKHIHENFEESFESLWSQLATMS